MSYNKRVSDVELIKGIKKLLENLKEFEFSTYSIAKSIRIADDRAKRHLEKFEEKGMIERVIKKGTNKYFPKFTYWKWIPKSKRNKDE